MPATKCKLLVTMLFACTTSIHTAADDDVRESDGLKVGNLAPDFEIEVLGGETITLSDYIGREKGVTVLLFNRAHW